MHLFLTTSETSPAQGMGYEYGSNQWHTVVLHNNLAEFADHFLSKGRQIMVEGRLRYSDWLDFSGAKRFTAEIHADKLMILGGGHMTTLAEVPIEPQTSFAATSSEEFRQSA